MTKVKRNILEKFYQAWEINPHDPNNSLCFYYTFHDKSLVAQLIMQIKDTINLNPQLQNCFQRDTSNHIMELKSNKAFVVNQHLINSVEIENIIQELSKFVPDLSRDLLIKVDCIETVDQNLFILFFNIHHILLDGKGLENFISSLNEAIPSYQSENCVIMPARSTSDIIKSCDYFQQLASIASEYEYTPHNSLEIFSDSACLPQELQLMLTSFAAKNQLSLFNLLLVAYAIFEIQLSNRRSTLVLYPLDRRAASSGELGCAVNSVILPFSLNPQDTFSDCLRDHQQKLEVLKQIAAIDLLDVLEYTDLTSNVTNFAQSIMAHVPALNGVEATTLPQLSSSPYGIKYNVVNQHIYFRFDCYQDVFTDTIRNSFLLRFFKFLDKLLTQPQCKLQKISLLMDDHEQKQLLYDFNETFYEYPRDATILDLFEDVVANYPENISVSAADGQLSYQELLIKSQSCAAQLQASGVCPGDFVAVLSSRSTNYYVMVLAVLYSGAAFIPLDISYPKERVLGILEDSSAFLLTNNEHNYPDLVKRIVTTASKDEKLCFVKSVSTPESPTCLIYTSGSTGKPKGVILTQRNIINFCSWYSKERSLTAGEHYAEYASFGFDAGAIMGTFPALLSGSSIYVVPEEIRLDLNAIKDFIIDNQIVGCFFATLIAEQFTENFTLQGVRFIECGGEKLKKYTPQSFDFYNGYGPTECTVYSTQYKVTQEQTNIPIGSPLMNYSCYVVNKYLQAVPLGVVGELLIGGDGVGLGYLNQPELTAEKFIANPFQSEEEKRRGYNHRVYKTGDLVRWLPDGNLEYIGRNDFQVKVRGYRIELGEIENRLQLIHGIKDACVNTAYDVNGAVFLCAYYTGMQYSAQELTETLGRQLASYMIPDHFIYLEKLPLTINGKVDRRALPAPDLTKFGSEYIAPQSEEERLICTEFANVLGLDLVGVKDNFYRLGGNSIKTVWLVSKLQANFKINVADVFKYKTPRGLAKNISYVKGNLKQKLALIKNGYERGEKIVSLNPEQQLRQHTYAAQVATRDSSPANYQMKPIQHVILTGATGYLGCNLLYQLLNTTNYRVIALVRATSEINAWQRVQAKYQFYFDSDLTLYKDRLNVYAADLEVSDLTLPPELYRHLQSKTDSILHSAALVKHYGEYDEFYRANVQASINLLEFAKNSRGKDFHYVSTYSVLQDGHIPGYASYFCDESVDGSIFTERSNVYVQTKYEGEVVTRDYRQFGITTNIYRVGNLSIISFNGRNQENIEENGFFTRVKAMLNIGAISSETATVEMSPVDITALGIIKLFDKQELSNQMYHVYSPYLVDLSIIFAQDPSLMITKLSINEFIDNLLNKLNLSTYQEQIEMFMLHQGWLEESRDHQQTRVQLAHDSTTIILTKLGINWPQINSLQLINDIIYKAYQARIKFLAETFTGNDIGEDVLFELAKVSQLAHYNPGDIIVGQEENDIKIKIIMNGLVYNYIKSSSGWISALQLNSTGNIANLEALFNRKSSSTYEAIFGSVTTLEITSDNLNQLATRYPQLNCNLLNHFKR